jgi:multidrug efflux pump subunit AcrA (membrane-fusion protein)
MKIRDVVHRVLVPAVALTCASSCHQRQGGDEENHSTGQAIVAVEAMPVVEGNAYVTVSAFGRTDALKKEKLYSPLAGRVVSLKAFEGTAVQKGDVLAVVQSRESESAILGAESMLQTATTPAQKAEAEKILSLAQETTKRVSVRATFGGYVATRAVNEGELVSENAELMTIVDLSTVDFLADIQLHELPSLAVGQHATIRFQSLPGKNFDATVEAISPQSDVQSQTVKARLRFTHLEREQHALLRLDMYGTASIVTGVRSHALLVPKTALLRNDDDNSYAVFTVTPDSLAIRKQVEIGVTTDSTAEINGAGIVRGGMVLIRGHYGLADSTRVSVRR